MTFFWQNPALRPNAKIKTQWCKRDYLFTRRSTWTTRKAQSYEDATFAWVRKRAKTKILVSAYRSHETGVPVDPRLGGEFAGDDLKSAKRQARELIESGTAMSAMIHGYGWTYGERSGGMDWVTIVDFGEYRRAGDEC